MLVWLFLSSPNVMAITLDDLKASDDFRVNVMLAPSENIIVTQEVSLIIDIATTGWLAHGTEFDLPELKSAIITQRDKFAINSTEREGQKTWAIQRWELSVFPITEGVLTVPAMTLTVNVSIPGKGIIKGQVNTPELTIDATVPPEMKGVDSWLAATTLTVLEEFDKPLESLKVGDAFKQTVIIKGERALAMMLPAYGSPKVKGLAVYPKQPELMDVSSRGDVFGERKEIVDYIIEEEGNYQLPERTFHYWNVDTSSHEKITIPSTRFTVGDIATKPNQEEQTQDAHGESGLFYVKAVIVLLAMVLLGYLFIVFSRKRALKHLGDKAITSKRILKNINQASKSGDLKQLARWLYVWMDHSGSNNEIELRAFVEMFNKPLLIEQVELILQRAYSPLKGEGPGVIKVPTSSKGYFKCRLEKLSKSGIKLSLEP
ncbi:MAG: hypothetical protein ACJASL_001776 [Paraglaciecola sp.]|jgi:hypothetical protein